MSRIVTLSGPIAFAAANFIVLVVLQRTAPIAEFGLFGFMQTVVASGMGLMNGMFGTPLALVIGKHDAERPTIIASFFKSFGLFCLLGVAFVLLVAAASGATPVQLAALAAAATSMWLRWFTRSLAVAVERQREAARSDLAYAATSVVTTGTLVWLGSISIEAALAIQIFACLVSLAPLAPILRLVRQGLPTARTAAFRAEFGRSGRWTTLIVVTTEIAATAHAYGITLLYGSAAYAPVALATLLFRPHGVILTGLVMFERPRLVASLRRGGAAAIAADLRFMRLVLLTTWLGNVALLAAIALLLPGSLIDASYDRVSVTVAVALVCAVVLLRSLREPIVAALQAMQQVRPVGYISVASAVVTAPIVVLSLLLAADLPAWSLLGPAAGELLAFVHVSRLFVTVRGHAANSTEGAI